MKTYILKNGDMITAIPIGKANIIIGDKNNQLTICDRAPNTKSKKARVICQCNCGNYTVINHQDFKTGKVKSCGCYQRIVAAQAGKNSAIDFTQPEKNINPFYRYIKPTEMRKYNNQIVWEIECKKCGQHYFEAPNELISEKRSHGNNPCKCWKKYSSGVQKIISILEDNNIQYEQEKSFSTCLSPSGNLLYFDFYLPKFNTLIEYDGQQHFQIAFGQSKEKLTKQKEYDIIKDIWCKNNNFKLIRIPYTQYKNITINDLLKGEQNIG